MNEYRDIFVVFMALALVSLLIFVAATIQVPSGPASGNMNAKKKSVSSARIRFGEPVIDVKRKTAGPFSTNAAEKTGSVEVQANKLDGNEPLTFTEYVFPINTNGMRKAIESISPALGECYQQWRSLDENVGVGAWEATFYFEQSRKVEKTSRVDNVALEHPSPDAQVMEQCMMEMFGMLRFEETGPRKFKHPLVFQ